MARCNTTNASSSSSSSLPKGVNGRYKVVVGVSRITTTTGAYVLYVDDTVDDDVNNTGRHNGATHSVASCVPHAEGSVVATTGLAPGVSLPCSCLTVAIFWTEGVTGCCTITFQWNAWPVVTVLEGRNSLGGTIKSIKSCVGLIAAIMSVVSTNSGFSIPLPVPVSCWLSILLVASGSVKRRRGDVDTSCFTFLIVVFDGVVDVVENLDWRDCVDVFFFLFLGDGVIRGRGEDRGGEGSIPASASVIDSTEDAHLLLFVKGVSATMPALLLFSSLLLVFICIWILSSICMRRCDRRNVGGGDANNWLGSSLLLLILLVIRVRRPWAILLALNSTTLGWKDDTVDTIDIRDNDNKFLLMLIINIKYPAAGICTMTCLSPLVEISELFFISWTFRENL